MKKSMRSGAVLSECQIQAMRLNKLEHRRLQRDINLMHHDLRENLARLQRQAQNLRYRYTNIVRLIKPNQSYQLWKNPYGYEIEQDETKNSLESIKQNEQSKSKTHQPQVSADESSSETDLPLLLSLNNDDSEPVEPIINFSENFLRPKTSPIKKHLPNQHRIKPMLTILNGPTMNSNNPMKTQRSESSSVSFLSSTITSSSRILPQDKLITTQKVSNPNALYQKTLQNQTDHKSVKRTRIEAAQLIDKDFTSQYRVLKRPTQSAGVIK
ncbi:unnamed protein product [Rotaria sp. Silwood2]|nr:unnamed protein product [Rotaria sp. Silwood2]CAF3314057.1 unnamed protein product [Rotaria sp. Silwood2]CAF3958155.1 unnamed protein product [Rotaria sp. Silwood2]CAF4086470.1 unnamed protein product [Rotaria sp. Silwood2]